MNKNIITGLIAVALIAVGGYFIYPIVFPSKPERKILYWTDSMIPGDRSDHPGKSPMGMDRTPVYEDSEQLDSVQKPSAEYYTCPMHPSVHKDGPGVCPICGMTLVKKVENSSLSAVRDKSVASVPLSPSKQILANVSTSIAKRISLEKRIRAVGRIDYAEPTFRHISTRFPGRLEKLYLTYTGQKVSKGDPVADIYSPEAISAQQEYLLAKESYEQVKDAAEIISSGALTLIQESRRKLLQWGFTEQQISNLESTKTVQNVITIFSPISGTVLKKNVDPQHYASAGEDMYDVADLSTVWMIADVYEFEIQSVKTGQTVLATTDAYPGKIFQGKITFISPTLDPSTRTMQLRAEFPNPDDELKLEMFVNAIIKINTPRTVVVPTSAVLSTGQRHIVWVEKEKGLFLPRVVRVGMTDNDYTQILDGIEDGEIIVSSGGYLIDSESQLQFPASGIK